MIRVRERGGEEIGSERGRDETTHKLTGSAVLETVRGGGGGAGCVGAG